ncbi:hypothetical protein, partial [Sansalvadorimonas verongulae]|uniref:hypothetical protein n=1 Tax=Sansalvadorimonas verongulae TaxID=2172824 RepID=UPI001E5BB25C
LNFVVTSLCIVICLSASVVYTAEDKSRSLYIIQLRPLDVISTGSIALYPASSTRIHPHEKTSCTIDRTAEHHHVYCQGKTQKTGLTLTVSTP